MLNDKQNFVRVAINFCQQFIKVIKVCILKKRTGVKLYSCDMQQASEITLLYSQDWCCLKTMQITCCAIANVQNILSLTFIYNILLSAQNKLNGVCTAFINHAKNKAAVLKSDAVMIYVTAYGTACFDICNCDCRLFDFK